VGNSPDTDTTSAEGREYKCIQHNVVGMRSRGSPSAVLGAVCVCICMCVRVCVWLHRTNDRLAPTMSRYRSAGPLPSGYHHWSARGWFRVPPLRVNCRLTSTMTSVDLM
jgi:hypothetical protein